MLKWKFIIPIIVAAPITYTITEQTPPNTNLAIWLIGSATLIAIKIFKGNDNAPVL